MSWEHFFVHDNLQDNSDRKSIPDNVSKMLGHNSVLSKALNK